ncbi:MAG: MarC family protein [Alphaproteobacteria bacterium]|nr:MarC family transcriptional regulator [Hyphomonas sp.]MBR9806839.1 MarC family protein [Alphaproteobacteria bacterium]|tara:strand:- start:9315 stop:9962 length:648 start_codon:yes stop_codon:yes gene_type:complete
MSADLISLFTATFVTFFVLIDALGVAPVFATLTAQGNAAYRRQMAFKSIFVASIIIFGFAFGGSWLLNAMHISIDAFRAAGGILLFLIALDMVFEKRTERREHRAEEHLDSHPADPEPDDISVFPLGIPMVAGPGSIATAMFYMSEKSDWVEKGIVLSAIGLNLLLTLVIFLIAGPLVRMMGASVAGALTRILGVILAALSVQLLIDGIQGAFGI